MLYIIPTPIGNLEDITLRALRLLKEVDVIIAEDTRTSGNLLRHYQIDKKLIPFHQHNEHKALSSVIQRLKNGEKIAVISDAGTPGISDAGFLLVRECVKENIDIECLPGATAFVPALINSGLPCDKFCFEGFLPHKKGRQTRLKELSAEPRTMIFYESPNRLIKSLEEFSKYFGLDRRLSVSRELSKMHEETIRGTVAEVLKYYSEKTVKGEIVIVVAGCDYKITKL